MKSHPVTVVHHAVESEPVFAWRREDPEAARAALPPTRFVRVDDRRCEQLRMQTSLLGRELLRSALKGVEQSAMSHAQATEEFQRAAGFAQREAESVLEFRRHRNRPRAKLHARAAARSAGLARMRAAHQLVATRTAALVSPQPRDVRTHHRQLFNELLNGRDHLQRPRAIRTTGQRDFDDLIDHHRHLATTALVPRRTPRFSRRLAALLLAPTERRTRRPVLRLRFRDPRLQPPNLRPQLCQMLLHDHHQIGHRSG